jgi:hypothetical protein
VYSEAKTTGQALTQTVSFTLMHGSAITQAIFYIRLSFATTTQYLQMSEPELHTDVLHLGKLFRQHLHDYKRDFSILTDCLQELFAGN